MQEDDDEEEEEEGDAEEDEDVGDVGDLGGGEEGHLFFGGAHEEETGGVEKLWSCKFACYLRFTGLFQNMYRIELERFGDRVWRTHERCQVLEAADLFSISVGKSVLVFQHEADFDHSDRSRSHQSVPKHRVDMGAELQSLRMASHAPPSQYNDQCREYVPSWSTVSFPTQPQPE